MKRKIFILLSTVFLLLSNGYAQHTIENRDTTEWIPLKDGEVREPYKRVGNEIYLFQNNRRDHRRLENVDIETFRIHINARYAKDKHTLYYGFPSFGRDWICGLCIDNDPRICAECFEGPIVPNVDPNMFTILNRGEKGDYGTDGKNVYYGGVIIRGADIHSFEILDRFYSKDKNTAFFKDQKMKDVDVKSFRAINDVNFFGGAADKNQLYRMGKKFNNANPNTVRFFSNDYMADDKNVYQWWHLIEGVDGKTFQLVHGGQTQTSNSYIKDKNSAFLGNRELHRKIEGSDGKTFQYLSHDYSKDKNHVYLHGRIIEGVDPNGFQVLSCYFQKNNNHVFYWLGIHGDGARKFIIQNADPETFQLVGVERIANNDFYNGSVAKDKNHVFIHTNIVDGADAKTFERIGHNDWKDKNFYYHHTGFVMKRGEPVKR